jgi:hypothetical protein
VAVRGGGKDDLDPSGLQPVDEPAVKSLIYPDGVYTRDGTPGNEHVGPTPSRQATPSMSRIATSGATKPIRSIATEKGCVLLDAERYYFDTVAKHGKNALYDTGMYSHPNDFGTAQSYGCAAALRLRLRKPTMEATAKRIISAIGASVFARRTSSVQRTTTALSIDSQLQVPLATGIYIVDAALRSTRTAPTPPTSSSSPLRPETPLAHGTH